MKQKKLLRRPNTFIDIYWLNCPRKGPRASTETKNFVRKPRIHTRSLRKYSNSFVSLCGYTGNLETRGKEGKLWQRFRGRNLWNIRGYSNVHTRAASNQGRAWSCGHRSLRSFTFAFRILRSTAVTIFPVNRPARFRVISMDYLNHSERRWFANTSLIRMSDRCQRNTRME